MSSEDYPTLGHLTAPSPPDPTRPDAVQSPIATPIANATATEPQFEKTMKHRAAAAARQIILVHNTDGEYGDFTLCNSAYTLNRVFSKMSDVTVENEGKEVWIRARVEALRPQGRACFLRLRDRYDTIQACSFVAPGIAAADGPSIEMIRYTANIPLESWVDVFGVVTKAKNRCTQTTAEIAMKKIFVVSAASTSPPFQIIDAKRCDPYEMITTGVRSDVVEGLDGGQGRMIEEKKRTSSIMVPSSTRYNHRSIDLRTPANQAIFTIQSRIGQYFREYLYKHSFIEIHTPKIIPRPPSEHGGSETFCLDYFGNKCHLAQSPQLYKQIVTVADFGRVFEVGHAFRAQQGGTMRHLCESIGLDLEMTIHEHYHEVVDLVGELLVYILNRLSETTQKEMIVVNNQYPFEPLQLQQTVTRITFQEAHEMLIAAGEQFHDQFDSIWIMLQLKLGRLMKEKYGCDLYIIDKYPTSHRPFYIMPCPEDPRYANSYTVFLRGEEIASGAQHIHDPVLLKKQAIERGIPIASIKAYLDTFDHGALPHAGCGLGLERLTFAFLGLKNIRLASLFPRDPHRCAP